MAPRIGEALATGKMTQLCRKVVHFKIRWNLLDKVSAFRDLFNFIRDRVLACYIGKKPVRYGRLSNNKSSSPAAPPESDLVDDDPEAAETCSGFESDSDLVNLKISLLGNSQIGKTTFLMKYVGDKQVKQSLQMKGLNLMDKICSVKGARIVFRIWDVGGDQRSFDQVPLACKDAVAVLFMFDLASMSTLHSVTGWYNEARKWNQVLAFSHLRVLFRAESLFMEVVNSLRQILAKTQTSYGGTEPRLIQQLTEHEVMLRYEKQEFEAKRADPYDPYKNRKYQVRRVPYQLWSQRKQVRSWRLGTC